MANFRPIKKPGTGLERWKDENTGKERRRTGWLIPRKIGKRGKTRSRKEKKRKKTGKRNIFFKRERVSFLSRSYKFWPAHISTLTVVTQKALALKVKLLSPHQQTKDRNTFALLTAILVAIVGSFCHNGAFLNNKMHTLTSATQAFVFCPSRWTTSCCRSFSSCRRFKQHLLLTVSNFRQNNAFSTSKRIARRPWTKQPSSGPSRLLQILATDPQTWRSLEGKRGGVFVRGKLSRQAPKPDGTEWTTAQWGCAPQVGNATLGAQTRTMEAITKLHNTHTTDILYLCLSYTENTGQSTWIMWHIKCINIPKCTKPSQGTET